MTPIIKTLDLDASQWRSLLDMSIALYAALNSPPGYGHNIDALLEAMVQDHANDPDHRALVIRIHGLGDAPQSVRDEVNLLKKLVPEVLAEFRAREGRDFPLSFEIV